MKIVYTGLREETFDIIKNHESLQEAEYVSVSETELASSWDKVDGSDIVLIGEYVSNPIKVAQMVYGHDSFVSIVLINEAANFQKIRQALLFTPFIGPTVHCISNSAGKGIAEVVRDQLQRTRQRRNYQRFRKNISNVSVPSSQKFERVKSDYLNKVLQEAPVGLILINKTGYILSFNRYAAALFSKNEREVLGHPLAELFPENLKEDLRDFFRNEAENNLRKTIHFRSGEGLQYLEVELSRVEKDDPSFKVALLKNVTDHVLAQKAVEESSHKVRMIVESMPEMAWTALPTGEVDYLNKRWFEYTGQNPENSGQDWVKAVHPEDIPEILSCWKKALQDGSLYQVEGRYLRAEDQSYRWHLARALPVRNQAGEILHWVGTCTDIQGLKNVEAELQKTAEELAASNEELTAANEEIMASNEELNESNERLVQVNSDLDNFIYTASHDLKAPISNIEGLVNILRGKIESEDKDPQVRKILEMMDTSIERFQKTIGDLTEVVKLQRLSDLEPAQINIREVIEDVRLDLRQQIEESEAELELELKSEPNFSFSYKNFKSIIYNLLSNAIKYRAVGRKPNIKIRFSRDEGYHVLCVADNGLGMNLKDEGKIFGMFQRMHSHVEGTGIGLYIVKKIVETAGGKIEVDSRLGEGSTFRIYFPVKKEDLQHSR